MNSIPVVLSTISRHTGLLIFSVTSVCVLAMAKLWYNRSFGTFAFVLPLDCGNFFCFALDLLQGCHTVLLSFGFLQPKCLAVLMVVWWWVCPNRWWSLAMLVCVPLSVSTAAVLRFDWRFIIQHYKAHFLVQMTMLNLFLHCPWTLLCGRRPRSTSIC